MAAATSSLPVPDSPVMRTRASVGPTRAISARTSAICGELPTSVAVGPSASRSACASARAFASWSAERSASSVASGASGFSRKWNAPSFVARTASCRPARPLIMITGSPGASTVRRSSVASPSGPPGIERSRSTASGR